jgi:voltage-gated potassium channel
VIVDPCAGNDPSREDNEGDGPRAAEPPVRGVVAESTIPPIPYGVRRSSAMPIFITITRRLRGLPHRRVWSLIGIAVLIILVGAGLFSITQHDSYWLALYWAITTATTVGYGDVLPHNTIGRVIASAVMLTTIPIVGAIFGILAGVSAVNHIRRLLGMDMRLPKEPYTVIFGVDPIVPRVLEELAHRDTTVVLVAAEKPSGTPVDVVFVAGDPTDERVIARAKPQEAELALIACEQDADTMVVAVTLHTIAPKLKMYALTDSPRVARALQDLGVTHTLSADELVGHTVAKALETPEAGDLLLQLVDATGYRLEEQIVDDALAVKTLSQARADPGRLILGIAHDGHVDLGIGGDPQLSAGDRLIVLHEG